VTKQEKSIISEKRSEEEEAKMSARRKAWRNLLIPAVGSAAFFTSTMLGIIRTKKQHGWPNGSFYISDYLLMGIPFLILGLGFYEEFATDRESIFNSEASE
jgi:hypothetical protein